MASLIRCDECKKLSDEPQVGYIGREFELNQGRYTLLSIRVLAKDLCGSCVKKMFEGNFPLKASNKEDDL